MDFIRPFVFSAVVFCTMLFSCKGENDNFSNEIIGTWDVYLSYMNSKPNDFMQDAYFTFSEDNYVASNIFEDNNERHYSVEKNRLKIDGDMDFDLNIGRLSSDTMYLEGTLSYYYMEYYLVKRE